MRAHHASSPIGCPAGDGYRRDIDGLRAVAVLAVVLFHAELSVFSGGFVGVDVFFVISGFLITRLLLSDLERREFSIVGFYERRIRRIFPALFAMVFASVAAGAFLLLPEDFSDLGVAVLGTTAFVSNVSFWWNFGGYFAGHAELSPLLHTWSLAVEEQFYLVFPLALALVVRRWRRSPWLVAVPLLALSLLVSAIAAHRARSAGFYLAPSRAWELMVGTLLALPGLPRFPTPSTRDAASIAGLALIAWSIAVFDGSTPFPGIWALLPCVGAALVIHAGTGSNGKSLAGRWLGSAPLVFVGLTSYSLYLWHWPVLVLVRHYYATRWLSAESTACALALSGALAFASWRFIERPFRSPAVLSSRTVFALAAATLALFLAGGASLVALRGLPQRFSNAVADVAAASRGPERGSEGCRIGQADTDESCRIGADTRTEPSFVVWGDSHAMALAPGIEVAARDRDESGILLARPGCPPLLEVELAHSGCSAFNRSAVERIAARSSVHTVVLIGRWAYWVEGRGYGEESQPELALLDTSSADPAPETDAPAVTFARGLERSLAYLERLGRRVVIIGPVPEIGWDVPRSLARQILTGVERHRAPDRTEVRARQARTLAELQAAAARHHAQLLLPHEVLCAGGRCRVEEQGQPLYRDDDHLSLGGAQALSGLLRAIFTAPADPIH